MALAMALVMALLAAAALLPARA
eukprot:SAG31_NODE_27182_length_430_cov_0.776435_1_plen_22_part_10